MMERIVLLPGQRFGRLTAVGHAGHVIDSKTGWKRSLFSFKCDCGKTHTAFASNVKRGLTKSCGCLKKDLAGTQRVTHGATRGNQWTAEYKSYARMIERCDPSSSKAKWYAERGIRVCPEWATGGDGRGYERFVDHIGLKPSPKHSIDRIDNDKSYEPGNVRWATQSEQLRNRTDNRMLSIDGRTLTLTDAATLYDINVGTLWDRLNAGWAIERALHQRPRVIKK